MKKHLFPEGKKFFKANLHCHTVISDGNRTPQEIKDAYMAKGYHAVAFTDHEALILHDDLTCENFVALNGYETAIKSFKGSTSSENNTTKKVHHLCLIKRRPGDDISVCFNPDNFTQGNNKAYIPFIHYTGDICPFEFSEAFCRYLVDEAHKNNFLVHYNHPRWSLVRADDILGIPFDSLEICNTDCRFHGDYNADFYAEYTRLGGAAFVVGADDNHNSNGDFDSFGAYTMICADALTYEDLTDALARGDAYVSTGPSILSAYVEKGVLVVRTSAAVSILVHSEGRVVLSKHGKDGYIDSAAFTLPTKKLGAFFRIEVIDSKGNHAYTRAYRTEDYV